jgi:hypothetical protein
LPSEEGDLARLGRFGDVEDLQPGLARPALVLLVIDQQNVVHDLDLVRVRTGRHRELLDQPRRAGIADVDDRGADAVIAHVGEEGVAVLEVDVHAVAAPVERTMADQAQVARFRPPVGVQRRARRVAVSSRCHTTSPAWSSGPEPPAAPVARFHPAARGLA